MQSANMQVEEQTDGTSHITPLWAGRYLGIPYTQKGRDRGGLDDWGLVRLVQAEQYGHSLPSFHGHRASEIDEQIYGHMVAQLVAPAEPLTGDVVLLSYRGARVFGVYLGGTRMLTVTDRGKRQGVCIMDFSGFETWVGRIKPYDWRGR